MTAPEDIKSCCAAAYGQDSVALVLGESYHPGGLALTRRLADTLGLRSGLRVADVAAGPGAVPQQPGEPRARPRPCPGSGAAGVDHVGPLANPPPRHRRAVHHDRLPPPLRHRSGWQLPATQRLLLRRNIIFPVIRRSRRFPAKEVFIAVTHGQAHIAARKRSLRDPGVLTANAAGAPVIFPYAPALDDGSAFLPHTSGGLLRLAPVAGRPGYYRDAASGSVWDSSAAAVQRPSRGAVLPRLPAFNVMWFVWCAFFPGTGVLG